jgi:hypothetical protein
MLDYSKGKIIQSFGEFGESDKIPKELYGAKIINFGTLDVSDQMGDYGQPEQLEGGLCIDYQPPKGKVRRLVLGFTELGMWVYSDEELKI